MSAPMTYQTKAIMVNCSIAVALLYQYWKGAQLFILVIAGIFVFVSLNLLIIFTEKKRSTSTN
jgi:hypothetical protein